MSVSTKRTLVNFDASTLNKGSILPDTALSSAALAWLDLWRLFSTITKISYAGVTGFRP
jgi:hypothetical protein